MPDSLRKLQAFSSRGATMARKKATRRRNARAASALVIACDAVSKDPNTNKATIYGVFDSIMAEKLPTVAYFAIYGKVFAETGSHSFAVEIKPPSGDPLRLADESMRFELEGGKSAADINITVAGMPIKVHGIYELRLIVDGTTRSAPYILHVVKTKRKR